MLFTVTVAEAGTSPGFFFFKYVPGLKSGQKCDVLIIAHDISKCCY